MILKTYNYLPVHQAPVHPQQQEIPSCSQEEQLETSLEVQPEDMTDKHQDGEHNPLEMVADGTSSTDQGGDFVFQTEVGINLETPRVTARHFALPIDQHQREVATRSTERGGDYPIQAYLGGNPKKATTARVAAREETAISWRQRGTTSTEQSKQFDPGG